MQRSDSGMAAGVLAWQISPPPGSLRMQMGACTCKAKVFFFSRTREYAGALPRHQEHARDGKCKREVHGVVGVGALYLVGQSAGRGMHDTARSGPLCTA